MANQCELCGRKLGFFNTKNICDNKGCDATVCNACLEKSNQNDSKSTWGTCDDCGSTYCGKHYENHPCDSEEEESEESEESSDDVESDSNLSVVISKDENLVVISQQGETFQDMINSVSEYLSKGYVISAVTEDDDYDSSVWLVKKNG